LHPHDAGSARAQVRLQETAELYFAKENITKTEPLTCEEGDLESVTDDWAWDDIEDISWQTYGELLRKTEMSREEWKQVSQDTTNTQESGRRRHSLTPQRVASTADGQASVSQSRARHRGGGWPL